VIVMRELLRHSKNYLTRGLAPVLEMTPIGAPKSVMAKNFVSGSACIS
jgi:hypothetical protein